MTEELENERRETTTDRRTTGRDETQRDHKKPIRAVIARSGGSARLCGRTVDAPALSQSVHVRQIVATDAYTHVRTNLLLQHIPGRMPPQRSSRPKRRYGHPRPDGPTLSARAGGGPRRARDPPHRSSFRRPPTTHQPTAPHRRRRETPPPPPTRRRGGQLPTPPQPPREGGEEVKPPPPPSASYN